MAGSIVAYGCYVPFLRIRRDEYISALGSCGSDMKEKAVMDIDEDTVTMAVEAARSAASTVDKSEIGVLALASANFPYQEKVLAGTLVEALGLNSDVLTSHHGSSALAGSEALLAAMGMLGLTGRRYALVVISDAPVAGDDADHGLGAAACAFVLSSGGPGLKLEGVCAHSAEYMGLRYRLAGEAGIRDIGVKAYSTKAYNEAVRASVGGLLGRLGRKPAEYGHLVLPQADVKADASLAKKMGFSEDQASGGVVFHQVGDAGCCTPFLGLCKALQNASPGDRMLVCTYGAGSGSQALGFSLNGPLGCAAPLGGLLEKKEYVGYVRYLKLKRII